MRKNKILGIIPARYASSRFPGKPLALIAGKPMIQHVFEKVAKKLDYVVVATDDERIFDAVGKFGGTAIMTSEKHKSGTERCLEALEKFELQKNIGFDIVINVQGDEPLISPDVIHLLIGAFETEETQIATLANERFYSDELKNPNLVKLTLSKNGYARYFSRSLIPFVRNEQDKNLVKFYTHIGIYAYRTNVLKKICNLPETNTEIAEKLEQNRWLENDFRIKVVLTDYKTIGVDTPEDLEKVKEFF